MQRDPFADIANLASGLNMNWGGSNNGNSANSSKVPTPATATQQNIQFSSPSHQHLNATPSPRAPSTPIHQTRSPNDPKPDYSRSHFDQNAHQNTAQQQQQNKQQTKSGSATAATGCDIFADILGSQGYNFASKSNTGPRSINEMRKEELVKDMDPDKLKIMEWVNLSLFI